MAALFCALKPNSNFKMKYDKKRMVIFAGKYIDNNQKNR